MYRAAITVLIGLFSVSAFALDRVPLFDTDKDLHVSYAELTSKCKLNYQLFVKADKNADGVLSESEMRTARAYLFSKCDK